MKPARLGIGWQLGVPSGWGIYGVNLALEAAREGIAPEIFFTTPNISLPTDQAKLLGPHLSRQPSNYQQFKAGPYNLEAPMLHALGDKLDFLDQLASLSGRPDVGVVFFESALIPAANIDRAKRFAVLVAGSGWNAEVLARHGFSNVRTCLQGVDHSLFKPGPKTGRFEGRFAIFSGGKLEYRKGQDLVVAAFKRFHDRYPDSVLVTAWHNPWPKAAQNLKMSTHTKGAPGVRADGRLDVAQWLIENGLPPDSFVDLGTLQNAQTSSLLNDVDIALMPNRCEGGTNLVAMECMASGVPVILSRNTGHLDLINADNSYTLEMQLPIGKLTGRQDLEGWGESSIEEIVSVLEQAYGDSTERQRRAKAAHAFMQDWSWHKQIGHLIDVVAEFSV